MADRELTPYQQKQANPRVAPLPETRPFTHNTPQSKVDISPKPESNTDFFQFGKVDISASNQEQNAIQPISEKTPPMAGAPIQRQSTIPVGPASNEFENTLNRARSGGSPLEPKIQNQMGQAMGADFSGVRVHTDAQADQLNRSIQAKAFTTGQDLFFRQGAYDPGSSGGQELIAHELTHVVQQGAAQPSAPGTISPKSLIQRTKVKVKGVIFGKTRLYDHAGAVVGHVSKDTVLDIQMDDAPFQVKTVNGDKSLVQIDSSSAAKLELLPDADPGNIWISSTRYTTLADEPDMSEDVESLGTLALDEDEDGDTLAVGSDGVKLNIAGKEIILSRSRLQASGGIEQSVNVEDGYSVTFPVPLGPLAPLALTFTLGFKAGVGATLSLVGVMTGSGSDASLQVTGQGSANAMAEANAGVGLGISAGIATVASELQAALGAEADGALTVKGNAAAGSDLVNAGTQADIGLSGAITAALNGVARLSIAIFSKDFKVTFKEWELGSFDWHKQIADIGQSEPFLPSKTDLGIEDDKMQDIYQAMDPMPTRTQKRWVNKLLKDYEDAKAAADSLREQGVDIENPDFWAVVDAYEEQTVYTIRGGRIMKATASEVMPLISSHLAEQMVKLQTIGD